MLRRLLAASAGFLACIGVAVAAPANTSPANTNPANITLVEPYGATSSTGTAAALVRGALSKHLRVPVAVRTIAGEAGGKAQDVVAAAPTDGSMLLVTQLLNPWAFKPRAQPAVTLEALDPVVRLTPGLSTVLFVAASSPIRSWEDFASAAKAGRVSLGWNANLIFAIPVAMMESAFGQRFADVARHDRETMIAAVLDGSAQAALLPSASVLANWPDPRLRPLLTFGGARNKLLDVPTFREKHGHGKVQATTGALAVFAPHGTPAPLLTRLRDAFLAAGREATVRKQAAQHHYPLDVAGPEVVRDAMARDARIYRKLEGTLREPN